MNPNQWVKLILRQNPYVMDINRKMNCYSYKSFSYIIINYKNRGMVR